MDQSEKPTVEIENTDTVDAKEQPPKQGLKRHVNKRNAGIVAGLVILLIIGALLFWRSRRMGYTKQFTIESWHEVAVQSDEIAGITKGDASLDKTNNVATALRKLDSTMKDQKVQLSLIPLLLNDRRAIDSYKNFVTRMGAYSNQIAGMGDDVTAITDEDITQANELAGSAKEQTEATKSQLSYLTETINPSLFSVPTYLESLKKLSDEAKAKVANEAKTKKEQAAQDVLDKQLVETSITGFMDGFISGDAAKMKRYMTPAFIAEYNFAQLSAEDRKYTYPASYRVVTNTKTSDSLYTVQVNVLYKYKNSETNDTNQFTSAYTYTVVYVPASGRWLVNTEKSS